MTPNIEELAALRLVTSVPETIDFYTKHLDFSVAYVADPARFTIMHGAQNVTLMFRQLPEGQAPVPNHKAYNWTGDAGQEAQWNWDFYLWVTDVAAWYTRLQEAGVPIVRPLAPTDYGNKDFEIMDPNGFVLCMGESQEDA